MFTYLQSFYTSHKSKFDYIVSILNYAILILYGLFVFEAFLRSTTFEINWHPYYHLSLKVILILLVLGKSLLKFMDNIPLYMLLGFCSIGFLLAYLQGNHGILLELILFTIAFVDVDYKKILYTFTLIISISLFIIIIASQSHILNNLIYRTAEGTERISFGIHYPTDFASYILYLCLSLVFIRKKSISFFEIGLMYILSYMLLYFCLARTSTICLIILASLTLLYKIKCTYFNNRNSIIFKPIIYLFTLATPICMFVSVGISYLYTDQNRIFRKLDFLFSNRLSLGKETFNNFDIKLFGQNIQMHGNGGYTQAWLNYSSIGKGGYNFIDSSYLSILFRYGLFVFICVIILFTLTAFFARKHRDYVTLIIIAIIAVHCMIEHHMLDLNYNPFMFILISSYYKRQEGHS